MLSSYFINKSKSGLLQNLCDDLFMYEISLQVFLLLDLLDFLLLDLCCSATMLLLFNSRRQCFKIKLNYHQAIVVVAQLVKSCQRPGNSLLQS